MNVFPHMGSCRVFTSTNLVELTTDQLSDIIWGMSRVILNYEAKSVFKTTRYITKMFFPLGKDHILSKARSLERGNFDIKISSKEENPSSISERNKSTCGSQLKKNWHVPKPGPEAFLSISALSLEACGSKIKSICKQPAEVKFILQNFCV